MSPIHARSFHLFVATVLAGSSLLGGGCGSGGSLAGDDVPDGEAVTIGSPFLGGGGTGGTAGASPEVLVQLAENALTTPLVSAATALGWKVAWKRPASGLWLFRPGGALASPLATLVHTLRLVPGVRAVEENLLFTIDDPFGGKQSQAPAFFNDLTMASMRTQPALQTIRAVDVAPAEPRPVVAVIDGGFLPHEALPNEALAQGHDALDGDDDPSDAGNATDDDADGRVDGGLGHGTAVAALVLAVAPSARVVAIRALDDEGDGSTATLAAAVDWAAGQGVDIINISAGARQRSAILDAMLASARQRGVVIVASAGNGDGGPVCFPASSEHALAVCGIANDRTLDPMSSRGPEVDLGAPSIDVVAPFPGTFDGYGLWQGTSCSAPLLAGALAQLLLADPLATPSGEAQGLLDNLARYPSSVASSYGGTVGGGVLDVRAALTR